MGDNIRYNKPNMTNLPRDLGIAIFRQIMKTPAPDRKKMREACQELIEKNVKVRKKEIAQKKIAE